MRSRRQKPLGGMDAFGVTKCPRLPISKGVMGSKAKILPEKRRVLGLHRLPISVGMEGWRSRLMGLLCKRCKSTEQVKNGLMRGKQRYLCKDCGLTFTDTPPRGKPLALKVAAVLLYVSGLSMNRSAQLLGVSTPTIQAWLEQFAAAYAQKPEPEGRAAVIELDEMCGTI